MSKTHSFHHDYHNLLEDLVTLALTEPASENRTAQKTWSMYGVQLKHDMSAHGFPLLWSKKINMRNVAEELFWFLRGSTDEQELRDIGVNIWKEWRRTPTDPDLGPIYGHQWRCAGFMDDWSQVKGFDQVAYVLCELAERPSSRRAVVSCWNPQEIEQMALPPCHFAWQIVRDQRLDQLHMIVTMRSGDVFLGVPYNMASYALLLAMYARALGTNPGTLTLNIGDAHLYEKALDAAQAQLAYYEDPVRIPKTPILELKRGESFHERVLASATGALALKWDDSLFELHDYICGPFLGVEVAV